jgi:hypothetical protein
MSDGCWDELGIAPTDDAVALRRAYVARLKTLDVDRDPAAFMRLREAFDEALGNVAVAAGAGDDATPPAEPPLEARFEPGPAERAAPERVDGVPYGALELFEAAFEALIECGETREAAAALEKALAQGVVPFGAEGALVRALVACTLVDATLSPAELDGIAATFDASEVRERADALRWYAALKADAARGNGIFGAYARYLSRPTRVARAMFREKHDLLSTDLPALRTQVVKLRRYERWLPAEIDPEKAERKLHGLERSLRGQEIVAVILFLLLAGLLSGLGHFMNQAASR